MTFMLNTLNRIIILLIIVLITGCQNESELLNKMGNKDNLSIELKSGGALLAVSYEITTYQRYECDFEELTELDLAHLNPSEEKQRIEMYLMPDGTVNMVIEELDFERTINIPHEIAPCDLPKIKRTEIIGNSVTFYDGNRKMLGSHPFQSIKNEAWADQMSRFDNRLVSEQPAKSFAILQSCVFGYSIEEMIEDAQVKGQFIAHDEHFVTVRTNLSETRQGATTARVVIVDKSINKVVASVTYNENEKVISRMYFGYQNDDIPLLRATVSETLLEMPSGAEAWQITTSLLENYKFNN